MTQIGFDTHACGVPADGDHCADVRGPGAGNAFHPMVARKFVGETSPKIVCLSHIYRIPQPVRSLAAKNVNAGNGIEVYGSDLKVLKFVPRAASARPD
jgi:hypothetical protein